MWILAEVYWSECRRAYLHSQWIINCKHLAFGYKNMHMSIKKIHSTEIDALRGDVVLAISTGSKLEALISIMILLVWKSHTFSLREKLDLLLNFCMNIHFVLYIIRQRKHSLHQEQI